MKKQPPSSILLRAIGVATVMRSMIEDVEECDRCGHDADLRQTIFLRGRFYCARCANSALLPHPTPVAVSVDAHTHSIL